jgi:hypothetical protein
MSINQKLDAAKEDLEYALASTDKNNRDFYIKNSIRFIEEAKEVAQSGINWIKFDRKNIPPQGKPYLITDGKRVQISQWPCDEWGIFEDIRKVSDVTHYAEVKLP